MPEPFLRAASRCSLPMMGICALKSSSDDSSAIPISIQSRKKFLNERRATFWTAGSLGCRPSMTAIFSVERERNPLNSRYARLASASASPKNHWRGNTRIAKHPTVNPHRAAADASLAVNHAPIQISDILFTVRCLEVCQSMPVLLPSQGFRLTLSLLVQH